MAKTSTPGYKKYIGYLKDIVYVIGLLAVMTGWMIDKAQNQAILETTVKNNTKTLEKVEKFMEKQTELNGKVIQYMKDN